MKKISLSMALILSVFGLCACGSKVVDVEETTLILNEDGTVTQAVVEDFDESKYSSDDLTTYVNDAVSTFQGSFGEEAVTMDKCSVKDGVAKMVLTFADASSYESFEGCDFFTGTVSEAMIAGYDFNEFFTAVTEEAASGEAVESADATHNVLGKVVIVSETTCVQVPGTISYVSASGTELRASDTVYVDMSQADGDVVYIIYE